MLSPVTHALIKIFARGFFRVNSGLLVFLFVMLISYCFFMNTAGDVNLISAEQLTFYHFIIVITFVSSPIMTLIIFVIWLMYTIKSWLYVIGQLSIPQHQFLFYSITSTNKAKQFKSWFCVQLFIFIPVLGYWVFASVVGIVFNHYVLLAVILAYILVLASISAFLYVLIINHLIDGNKQTYLLQLSRNWHKPYFSLFIYHVFDQLKLNFVLAKMLSYLIITAALFSFPNAYEDLRVAGIVMLSVVTAHSIIFYHNHRFEETRLSFSKNLPYGRITLFFNLIWVYLLLILPECIWLFSRFNLMMAIQTLVFGLSTALLFRSILYGPGISMKRYLPVVFFLFVLFFWMIMFKWIVLLALTNILLSFIIFYERYYQANPVVR